jgi:ankyrin repeat protein
VTLDLAQITVCISCFEFVVNCCNFFVHADADCVLEVDCLSRTALMYAVNYSSLDTMQLLLEHGVDVNAVAEGTLPNCTALSYIRWRQHAVSVVSRYQLGV